MPSMALRWKLVAISLFCYTALALYFGADVRGQKEEGKEKGKDGGKKQLDVVYYGVSLCANKGCHGGSPPDPEGWVTDKDDKPLGLLCRCNEAEIWKTNDKHADAYNVLKKERGQQMAKILGYDVTDPKGKGKACLACHAVVLDEKTLAASKLHRFNIEEGVNCVVCHGPHGEWVAAHGVWPVPVRFRPLSRKIKEDEYGMRNLWDPIERTELCASCHIGNLAEGKFLSHDMYAAGHPPLPGFEVATFSDEMPRHWQYLREKTPSIQKELGLRPGEQEQTQMVLVGAAVSLRESMRLLEAQARAARKATGNRKLLDLSNFDCFVCHRDLKSPSWAHHSYKRKPGHIPTRPYPTELIQIAIKYLAALDKNADDRALLAQLTEGIKMLPSAFEARPYGDPVLIEKAAARLAIWADTLARRLNVMYSNRKAAVNVLSTIPPLFSRDFLDYNSARQVGWAYAVIFNEVNWRSGSSPEARKTLDAIDKELKLRLPRGRKKLIADELDQGLEKITRYDPAVFRALLDRLASSEK